MSAKWQPVILIFCFLMFPSMIGAQAPADPLPPRALYRIGDLKFRPGGAVYNLAFSPDGKTLLSAVPHTSLLFHTSLRAWDVTTGKVTARFYSKAEYPHHLAFAPDGKTLTAIDRYEHFKQFEFPGGKELRSRSFPHSCLGASPDGFLVAIGAEKGPAQVLEAGSGKVLQTLANTTDQYAMSTVAISPDRKTLAGYTSQQLRLFDIATGTLIREIPDANGASNIVFSPDGQFVLMVSQSFRLYQVSDGKLRHTFGSGHEYLNRGVFSPDGKFLATTGKNAVNLYDSSSGKLLHAFLGHLDQVYALAFAPDGATLASAGADGVIRFWNPRTGQEHQPPAGLFHSVVAVHSVPGTLAYATADGRVTLCDPATRKIRRTLAIPGPAHVPALAFAPDGRTLAYRSSKKVVTFLDPQTGRSLGKCVDVHEWVDSLTFAPDGKTLFSTGAHQPFTACAAPSGEFLREVNLQENTIAFVYGVVSPGRRWLIGEVREQRVSSTMPNDHTSLWNLTAGKKLSWFPSSTWYSSFAFAPDGRTVACVQGWGLGIDLLEIATGCRRAVVRADYRNPNGLVQYDNFTHRDPIVFSADGTLLAVRRDENKIEILDPKRGKRLETLAGHRGRIRALAFSPDGNTLYSTSTDTTLLAWDVADLRDQAGFPLQQLSAEEIRSYWDQMGKRNVKGEIKDMDSQWLALAASPQQAVPFLESRLAPVPPLVPEQVAQWLNDLGDPRFKVRDRATHELEKIRELAERDLRKLMASRPSLEVHRRVEQLLRKVLQDREEPLAADRLRQLRALEVLEAIGSPVARALVERLASGAPGAWLTLEARETLDRWQVNLKP